MHGQTGTVGYDEDVLSTPTNISVVNEGTIQADVAGGTITIDGTGSVNEGALNALNRATLSVEDTLTNRSTISVDSTSVLDIGGTVVGGSITGQSGSLLDGGTFDAVTLTGTLTVSNNSGVIVDDGLTLDGTLDMGSTSSNVYGYVAFVGSQTLGGTGTVVFGEDIVNTLEVAEAGTTLTIGPDITVHGQTGWIGFNSRLGGTTDDTVVNEGTISADVSGGTVTVYGLNSQNAGTFNAAQRRDPLARVEAAGWTAAPTTRMQPARSSSEPRSQTAGTPSP